MDEIIKELKETLDEYDPTDLTSVTKANIYDHLHHEIKTIVDKYEIE